MVQSTVEHWPGETRLPVESIGTAHYACFPCHTLLSIERANEQMTERTLGKEKRRVGTHTRAEGEMDEEERADLACRS